MMPNKRRTLTSRITSTMAAITGHVFGEISRLRSSASTWGTRIVSGRYSNVYRVDSSKVDYALARALYDNTDERYKLGAWAAKPVINTPLGFMGIPRFRSEDENAQEVLDEFFGKNVSQMQETHKNAMRDGDCHVWITREENGDESGLYPESHGVRLVYNIIPPEKIEYIVRHPLTGEAMEYVLLEDYEWYDDGGNVQVSRLRQHISAESRRTEVVRGNTPPNIEEGEERNPWGFLPIVQFSNEPDVSALNGKSDLECIEPYMKAYHDILSQAISGHKLHSMPRLKLQLKDIATFLQNNFGVEDPAKFVSEGKTINLEGHELLFLQNEDDASFAEVKSAIGSTEPLLKFLFYCIIDASETPEFAFGAHMPASHASVKEQMPVLIRRVSRKREQFTDPWQRLARIVLTMTAKAEGRRFATHDTTLLWDEIDPRDGTEAAEELKTIIDGLSNAMDHALISQEAAVNFLAGYIDTMSEYVGDNPEIPGEREKILRDRIRMARLEDSQLAEQEQEMINKVLADLEGGGG